VALRSSDDDAIDTTTAVTAVAAAAGYNCYTFFDMITAAVVIYNPKGCPANTAGLHRKTLQTHFIECPGKIVAAMTAVECKSAYCHTATSYLYFQERCKQQ
jgi:pyruvate/2-oxoglutarate/acetoin dehydrogenase E1 component